MSDNINLFNAALKLIRIGNPEQNDIGTTAEEFAENYANASGAEKGSSVWNEYFEQGKEEYKIINTDGKDGITQEEYNKLSYYINKITQPFKHYAEDFLSGFEGNNTYIAAIRTRVKDNSEEELSEKNDNTVPDKEESKPENNELIQSLKQTSLNTNRKSIKDKIKNIPKKPSLEINYPERKNLKMIETMSKEEIISEIQEYDTNYNVTDNTSLALLKKYLGEARMFNILNDKNSNIIDYHIGTFKQGGHGTCTILSKINGLSDETLKKIYQEFPEGSGNYKVTFPQDYGNKNQEPVIITKEELESGEIKIQGPDGKDYLLNDFTQGDKDVMLLEMAFMKRFGTYISLNGADVKLVEEIFTFPEDKSKRVLPENERTVESYKISEEKIIQALKEGNHPIVAITNVSRLPADFSYQDTIEAKDKNGDIVSAHWDMLNKGEECIARLNLKKVLGPNSPLYSKIDDMPVGEFMDLANKFVGAEFNDGSSGNTTNLFGFIGAVVLSNGAVISENHALSIVDYDTESKTVIIANPNENSHLIRIPLEVMEKFFEISV